MKYLKRFESLKEDWNNIVKKDGKIYINLYELANEMEDSVVGETKYNVAAKEDEYRRLVRVLLMNKVISFYCSDCGETHTGICDDVSFSGGGYPGMQKVEPLDNEAVFDIQYIHISTEDMDYAHGIDGEVIVHLDEDPDIFRNANKYNL